MDCAMYVAGPVAASRGNKVATVDTTPNYELAFTMELASDGSTAGWRSILHIGNSNSHQRVPGIWFRGGTNQMWVWNRPSRGSPNKYFKSSINLAAGKTYEVKLVVEGTRMTLYVDGVARGSKRGIATAAATDASVYVGNPWYAAADVTLSDICLKAL